jgi:hypothetical protein
MIDKPLQRVWGSPDEGGQGTATCHVLRFDVGNFNDHTSYGVSTFLHRRQTTCSFYLAPLAPAAVQALSPSRI